MKKRVHHSNHGQVLIIFVFVIIGLIGVTGLAIDGGNIYSDRRHAQNAADTSALAAALYRNTWVKGPPTHAGCNNFNTETGLLPSCSADIINKALDMASKNGYTNDPLLGNRVDVYNPPIDGYYKQPGFGYTQNDYIEVKIKTTVNTFFARVLGIGQLHNTVYAVALSRYAPTGSLYGGNSLVVLKPYDDGNCTGDAIIGGNGTVVLNGGGLFVNSSNSCAAYREGSNCPTVTLNNGAHIQVYGAVNTTGCKTPPSPIDKATSQLLYPPDPPPLSPSLIPPAECNTPGYTQDDPDQATYPGFTDVYPGHYASLPPTKNTRLMQDPAKGYGVFCVDSLIKTSNSYTLLGDGVFIYFRPTTAAKQVDITGGLIQLSAPTSGPYARYLMYMDATDWTYHPACNFTGGTSDKFDGVIYAPDCDVTINGGSSPTGYTAQIIAYTLKLNGSTTLNFTYDPSQLPQIPEINWTGLFH